MSTMISRDDVFFIIESIKSRYGEGIYGYIDRETGEVLIGSQDDPLETFPDEDDENYEAAEAEFNHRYLPIP